MTAARVETLAGLVGERISFRRGGRLILDSVDITAEHGRVLALTGPSGSGKSSLLAVLALLEDPDGGRVLLDGGVVDGSVEATRQRYGLVLQGYGLVSLLGAAENVELALQAAGVPPEEIADRTTRLLDRLGIGAAQAEHLVEQLSGGQQQRVAVARALAGNPEVILADEPTAALDPDTREVVLDLIFDAARRGAVVILATHDREVADRCDSELALHDGRVVAIDGVPVDAPGPPPPSRERAGQARPRRPPARLLSAEDIAVMRVGRAILSDVSLEARAGEAVAITGPSGAGKSTLLAVLAGLQPPDAGRVLVDGAPLAGDTERRERIGLVLQSYGLMSVLTAAESVEIALQRHDPSPVTVRARAADALARVGLADRADHLVDQLSGGQQQRLALARAVVVRPEILLADEPTAELDEQTRDRVLRLLLEEAERGAIVLVATHDDEVAARCHRRIRLSDGKLI